jgi:hypothetical protein
MYTCELLAYPNAKIKSVEFTNVEKELTFKIKQRLDVVAPGLTLWEYSVFFGQSGEDVLGQWKCTVKYKDQPDEIFLLTVNDILRLPVAEGFRAWFEGGTWNLALRANIGLPQPPSSPPTNVQYLLRVFSEDMHTIVYENRFPMYDGRENLVVFAGIPATYSGYIVRTGARLYGFGAAVVPGQVPEIRPYFSRSLL